MQNESYYWDALHREGYAFFTAADESGYLDGMIHGNDPLCYGVLYLYAMLDDHHADVVAGFCQNS